MLPLAIEVVPGHSRRIETTLVALLMRLGVTTLRGSNPRSSATDQPRYDECVAYLRRFRGSALVSPHNARTGRKQP